MIAPSRDLLLGQVAFELAAMATRLGWQVRDVRVSRYYGSRYLYLSWPGSATRPHNDAVVRVADHASRPGSCFEGGYEWILGRDFGQPFTPVRDWLWNRAVQASERYANAAPQLPALRKSRRVGFGCFLSFKTRKERQAWRRRIREASERPRPVRELLGGELEVKATLILQATPGAVITA
jgi:hypothetical protein